MLNILIVEDAPGVAFSIGTALRAEYIRLMGEDCARKNPLNFFVLTNLSDLPDHRHDPIDAILLDLRLPPHMEHDTLQWLDDHAEEHPPIIAISALDHADDGTGWELPAIDHGAMGFWHKCELDTRHGAKRLFTKISVAMRLRARQKRIAERIKYATETQH